MYEDFINHVFKYVHITKNDIDLLDEFAAMMNNAHFASGDVLNGSYMLRLIENRGDRGLYVCMDGGHMYYATSPELDKGIVSLKDFLSYKTIEVDETEIMNILED